MLFGLSAYVYSPLHRDEPGVRNLCPFCAFQHLRAEPAAVLVVIVQPTLPAVCFAAGPAAQAPARGAVRVRRGRAPPLAFLAI
jgi:hypothetical protein